MRSKSRENYAEKAESVRLIRPVRLSSPSSSATPRHMYDCLLEHFLCACLISLAVLIKAFCATAPGLSLLDSGPHGLALACTLLVCPARLPQPPTPHSHSLSSIPIIILVISPRPQQQHKFAIHGDSLAFFASERNKN